MVEDAPLPRRASEQAAWRWMSDDRLVRLRKIVKAVGRGPAVEARHGPRNKPRPTTSRRSSPCSGNVESAPATAGLAFRTPPGVTRVAPDIATPAAFEPRSMGAVIGPNGGVGLGRPSVGGGTHALAARRSSTGLCRVDRTKARVRLRSWSLFGAGPTPRPRRGKTWAAPDKRRWLADRPQWTIAEPFTTIRGSAHLGMMTVSITWITPFDVSMSVLVTFAPSTVTLPSLRPSVFTLLPSFIFTTSAAITLPGTTW